MLIQSHNVPLYHRKYPVSLLAAFCSPSRSDGDEAEVRRRVGGETLPEGLRV